MPDINNSTYCFLHLRFLAYLWLILALKSGSLNGVLLKSLYNKAWFVRGIALESLERLLLERFIRQVIRDKRLFV